MRAAWHQAAPGEAKIPRMTRRLVCSPCLAVPAIVWISPLRYAYEIVWVLGSASPVCCVRGGPRGFGSAFFYGASPKGGAGASTALEGHAGSALPRNEADHGAAIGGDRGTRRAAACDGRQNARRFAGAKTAIVPALVRTGRGRPHPRAGMRRWVGRVDSQRGGASIAAGQAHSRRVGETDAGRPPPRRPLDACAGRRLAFHFG